VGKTFAMLAEAQRLRAQGLDILIGASSTASEIWSAILSGCPSDTDSDVNRCFAMFYFT
jgi:hypothetical protein